MGAERFDGIVPIDELERRIGSLQQELQAAGVDGALIIQKTDLFYFSSTAQQGWLYVPSTGQPLLLVSKDYERARSESSLSHVCSVAGPKQLPVALAEYGYPTPQVFGLELDVLPVNFYFSYQRLFPSSRIVDISTKIRLLRAIKSPYEVEMIRRAAHCSDQVFAGVADVLAEGRTEIAVAADLERIARNLGHQGIVRMRMWGGELFFGHLLSGVSASVPSYLASPTGGTGVSPFVSQGAGWRVIAGNEPVLVDYVFALNGYLVDHARIFCIGRLADDLMAAHEDMRYLQEWMRTAARPGACTGELYEEMVLRADAAGWGDGFMGIGDRRIRFTGHGIGLELDEFPFIAKGQTMKLAEGMILALEPKVIVPGRGVVGVENTHLVCADGLEQLTISPDEVICL